MKWIWLVNSDENTPNTYGDFTDSFTVRFECASPGTARVDARRNAGAKTGSETDNDVSAFFPGDRMMIRISADSQYALWINSVFVSTGQFADFPDAKVYDEINISDYLREGENTLRFLIYYQGTSSSTYLHGEPGFCYVVYNGEKVLAESSAATLGRLNPAYRSGNMEMITGQLGYSFEYNAQALQVLRPYFPAAESRMALYFAEYPLKPRERTRVPLYPRPIQKLIVGPPARAKIVTQGLFRIMSDENDALTAQKLQHASLSQRYTHEITDSGYTADLSFGGVQADAETQPFHFRYPAAKPYHGIYALVDLGRESAGYFHIDIDAPAGTKVYIGYGEHLIDLRVRSFVGGRCFSGVYTCCGGKQQFTHYSKRMGLRYVQIFVTSFDFKLYYAGILNTDYPLTDVCGFSSSDSLHNKIYQVSLDTLRLCMHEHYEDCPWREQALYSMDSRNQMLAGYYSFGEYDFPKASLRLLSHSLRSDGQLELCAPAKVSVWIPCFSLMWIVELCEYVLYSGDYLFAAEVFPTVEKIIHTFWLHSRGTDRLGPFTTPGAWNFYEWSDLMDNSAMPGIRKAGEDNADAPLTLFYALALDAASKLSAWLIRHHEQDDEHDYRRQFSWYEMLHKSVVSSFHDTFWNSERDAYATYIVNGSKVHYSELTHALALYAGAVPAAKIDRVAEILTGKRGPILLDYEKEADSIVPGSPKRFVPVTLSHSIFKYEALLGLGSKYAAYVFDEIAEKWGYMLYNGATSFWEHIDGAWAFGDAGSLCHGWSAIPVILYGKYVLGITPLRPGFADFDFKPLETPLIRAKGQMPLPGGEAVSVNIGPGSNSKSTVHKRRTGN